MNRDRRTAGLALRRIDGWATLNNRNLQAVQAVGLPIAALLSAGEAITDPTPIAFVRRRNKVAHGDFGAFIKTLADYDPVAETDARDQLQKAQRFVVEWFNTGPDVQEGHIKDHKWQ